MVVKAFDTKGNIHKILRVFVDKDFNITYKTYKGKEFDIEPWDDTAKRNKHRLLKLEQESMLTIQELLEKFQYHTPYICHSSGKDSVVLSHLVRSVRSNIQILFNNTSNESGDTYKMMKSIDNVRTLNPKEGFWQYLKRENFIPSRLARSCCNIYKHNLTLEHLDSEEKHLLFMGMRNEESNTRSEYQTEHQFDYYPDSWVCGLPIRQWTELDVWLYILLKDLPINTIYKYGYARCGCVVCPFRNNLEEILTKHYFPRNIARFNVVQESNFLAHERWTGLNCTLDEFMNKGAWKGGQYRKEPTPEVIAEFAGYKGLDVDIATKYFDKRCVKCDRAIRQSNVVAMNLKFHGREIEGFYCKKHLQELLHINHKQWLEYIDDFKNQGCELF